MTLFVDMDEVIADTYGAHLEWYNRDFNASLSLEECHGKEVWEMVPEPHKESIWKHYSQPGFFRSLKPIPFSKEVLQELNEKYEVFIASAAMQFPNSLKEKSEWLDEHFPFMHWKNTSLREMS